MLAVLLALALAGPMAAYAVYPSEPNLPRLSREISQTAGGPRPLPSLVESMGHAASYRGRGFIAGEPRPLWFQRGVLVAGKPVIPAPGPWVIRTGNSSRVIPSRDVAILLHRSRSVEAWGVKAYIYLPRRGAVSVLIAMKLRLTLGSTVVELRWLGAALPPRR